MEQPTYQINVRYAVEFVKQLLPQVDAATSLILVGDLSQCRLAKLDSVVREAIEVKNPVFSESYGRLIIPLLGPNKYELKKNQLHRIGLRQHITEVQLERYGRLLFQSLNQFHDPVWLSDWFRQHFIQEMVETGIIDLKNSRINTVTPVRERPFRFRFAHH